MLSKLISNMEGLIAYSGLYQFSKLDAIGGYRHLKGFTGSALQRGVGNTMSGVVRECLCSSMTLTPSYTFH